MRIEVITAVSLAAIKNHFEIRTKKWNQNSYVVKCMEDNCAGMVRASKFKGRDIWIIRKYEPTHMCTLDIIQSSFTTFLFLFEVVIAFCGNDLVGHYSIFISINTIVRSIK